LDRNNKKNSVRETRVAVTVLIIALFLMIIISYYLYLNSQKNDDDVGAPQVEELEQLWGYTIEGNWSRHIININLTHIVKINFTLEWRDMVFGGDLPGNDKLDEFDVIITAPDQNRFSYKKSELVNVKNRTGYIFIEFINNSMSMRSGSYTTKRSTESLQMRSSRDTNWEVNITCLKAYGFEPSCSCPSAVPVEDGGNYWIFSSSVYYYLNN
jgi:hypothetical protein